MEKAVHLLISGRVQGVFYRYTAVKVASRLNLRGWIKNLPDGRVEAIAVGDLSSVESFITWCREGPPGAIVAEVKVSEVPLPPNQDLKGFSIVY